MKVIAPKKKLKKKKKGKKEKSNFKAGDSKNHLFVSRKVWLGRGYKNITFIVWMCNKFGVCNFLGYDYYGYDQGE